MDKDTSLYAAIYEQLISDIKAGKYNNGVRLPTEMELTQRYFVSRITAKRALNNLAEAGLVVRIPGRGTFLKGTDPVCSIRAVKSAAFILPSLNNRAGVEALRGVAHCAKACGISFSAVPANNEACSLGSDGILSFIAGENPYVEVRMRFSDTPFAIIGANAQKAVTLSIDRLEAAGHRNIMIFTAPSIFMVKDTRHPIAELSSCTLKDITDFDKLTNEIRDVLANNPQITAVITCNSFMTEAMHRCLKSDGDISLIAISAGENPARMGFSQYLLPMYEVGRAAFQLLKQGSSEKEFELLEPVFIDRGSVKPI